MSTRGATLLEMLTTMSLLGIMATVIVPAAKHVGKRSQELELKQVLRTMRLALDDFKRDWSRDGEILTGALCVKNKLSCKEITGVTGYPKALKTLLGVELTGQEASVQETKAIRRYLRRIPVDPMTGNADWGLRCYQDPPDTRDWCGEDVFDVFSKSDDEALDHTQYRDW